MTFLRLNFGLIRLLVSAAGMAVVAPALPGQAGTAVKSASASPASAAYVPVMTFDVATVREAGVDKGGGFTVGGGFVQGTTHLRTSLFIDGLLSIAYGVDGYQLSGLPKWPKPTIFQIEAKGDGDADTKMARLPPDEQKMEQQHMLQVLLEERFKLKLHWGTVEGDIYNLVVAKGGPKLGNAGSKPASAEELKRFGDRPVPVLHQTSLEGEPAWIAHGCSMAQWTSLLSSIFRTPCNRQI